MQSRFAGQLTISNTKVAGLKTFSAALTFTFVELDQVHFPGIWSVSVAGATPETFPVAEGIFSDTVTATPGPFNGAYNARTGAMTLSLQVDFTDTGGHLPSHAEPVMFDLATNQTLSAAQTGMDASGSPLNRNGDLALVGSATMSVHVLFSTVTFTLGVKLSGTLAAPIPPVPAPGQPGV